MFEPILTLTLAAIVLIGAPGPAAMALAAIGSTSDMRQGLPLIFGLVSGVLLTGLLTSAGLLAVLIQWPAAKLGMQVAGGVFILIMAARMIRTPLADSAENKGLSFGYRAGILMNILSPKAYATFMVLITKFMPPMASKWMSVLVLEAVSLGATLVVTFGWLFVGGLLRSVISSPRSRKRLQVVFACMMIVFVMPVLFSMPG